MSVATIAITDNVVAEVLDGETVLLNLDSGVYFALNETGTRIWQLIQQLGRVNEVTDAMVREYAAPRATVEQDLQRLVAELQRQGLIRLEESNP